MGWTYLGGLILFIKNNFNDRKGEIKTHGNLGNLEKKKVTTA